jgi:addiction module RelE/StbE family toxin
MSSIRWSPEAADDLERIYRRIETDNPAAALRVVQTIYDAATTLQTFPERGRLSRRSGAREIVFSPPLPYILVYRVTSDLVEISRIWHAAQDWH